MKRIATATVIALCLAWPALADDYTVGDLAWMAGYWTIVAQDGRTEVEELWLAPDAQVMIGINRDVRGRRAFFEYLRIEQRDDGVYYVARPSNQPEAAFRLVEIIDGARAVFENPGHDFPQRITYELSGHELTATVQGMVDGETESGAQAFRRTSFERSPGEQPRR